MILAETCYRSTRSLPKDEAFGLTTQVRRAAASIPANIAEGYGRESTGSFIQCLRIAQGSLKELETHILLAERVNVAMRSDVDGLLTQCERVGEILRALIRSLQRKRESG